MLTKSFLLNTAKMAYWVVEDTATLPIQIVTQSTSGIYNKYRYTEELLKEYSYLEIDGMYEHGRFSAHNCASWTTAILYSLDDYWINYYIGVSLKEYFVSSPTIHFSNTKDISNTIKCAKNDTEESMKGSSEVSNEYFSQTIQSSKIKSQEEGSCFVS